MYLETRKQMIDSANYSRVLCLSETVIKRVFSTDNLILVSKFNLLFIIIVPIEGEFRKWTNYIFLSIDS